MAIELLGLSASKKLQGEDIRSQITSMVNYIKKDFRIIPMQFNMFNQRLAKDLRVRWEEENKKYRSANKRESAVERLERWKEMKKEFRLIALNKLTADWYDRIWKLRAELSLITAIYEYSEIEEIFHSDSEIKPKTKFSPVVLRMKGPRKPTKKKFKVGDIDYDIGDAYLEMIKPLEEWTIETKIRVDKLSGVRAKQTLKTKIKRYKDTFIAREYMSVYAQSLVPRTDGIILNGNEEHKF